MTTTKYATWTTVFGYTTGPRDDVNNYTGDGADDYDLNGVEADYRAAIAALLPGSMLLVGDEFIADVDDPEIPEDWADTLREQELFTSAHEMGEIFEANPARIWDKLSAAGVDLDRVVTMPDGVYNVYAPDGAYVAAFGHATTETGESAEGWDAHSERTDMSEWFSTTDALIVWIVAATTEAE